MLYIVPTPVGNLEDITYRAVKILEKAEIILAEDSRQTRKLMNLLKISNKPKFVDLTRNHNINYLKIQESLELSQYKEVVLVSDSGTPGISDPGLEVIKMAINSNTKYTTLPGATSLIPAVIDSGLIFKEFWFKGFLPLKKGRKTQWQVIKESKVAMVIFESVHRMEKFLQEAKEYLEPERQIAVLREISKLNESFYRFKVEDIEQQEITFKGEFVIVIEAFNPKKELDS